MRVPRSNGRLNRAIGRVSVADYALGQARETVLRTIDELAEILEAAGRPFGIVLNCRGCGREIIESRSPTDVTFGTCSNCQRVMGIERDKGEDNVGR